MNQLTRNSVLTHVVFAVRNSKTVKPSLLQTPLPHTDLVLVYRFPLDDERSALLSEDNIAVCDLSQEEVHKAAIRNTMSLKFTCRNLADILGIGVEERENPLYCISTEQLQNGASVIANPNFMKSVADKLKDDLYVLPSSIHELIVVPKSGFVKNHLLSIVSSVNKEHVKESEWLSDNVYQFSRSSLQFALA